MTTPIVHPKSGEEPLAVSPSRRSERNYTAEDFKITMEVGEGSFGRVFLVNRKTDLKKFAIKVVDKHHIIKVCQLTTAS